MDKIWPLGKRTKGISGLAGFPGTLAVAGLLAGIFLLKEDIRLHPVAKWAPLLILLLLIPAVLFTIRSELKGTQRGVFRKQGEELIYEHSMVRSRVVRVYALLPEGDGYRLRFEDEQGRETSLLLAAHIPDLGGLIEELRAIERRRISS